MIGLLKLAILVTTPIDEVEGKVFSNLWSPQTVITNRLLSINHKCGTRDYDSGPWDGKAQYHNVVEGSADSWSAHLKRTLSKAQFDAWETEMNWRYNCWNALDDYVNGKRYGFSGATRLAGLAKLKANLTPDQWVSGWMPSPIPNYPPEIIGWLQNLWTERTDFQGPKNDRARVNPLHVEVPVRGYGD